MCGNSCIERASTYLYECMTLQCAYTTLQELPLKVLLGIWKRVFLLPITFVKVPYKHNFWTLFFGTLLVDALRSAKVVFGRAYRVLLVACSGCDVAVR